MVTPMRKLFLLWLLASSLPLQAALVREPEYGGILFNYYQQDYFAALVQYQYAAGKNALQHHGDEARLLQGGMALSYGLTEQAEQIFNELLTPQVNATQRNRAWFYLAKLHHQKADIRRAAHALQQIDGSLPADLAAEFNYLATLINISNQQLDAVQQGLQQASSNQYQPYLLYNLAISQLKNNDQAAAAATLNQVMALASSRNNAEMAALADRARHALSQLALQQGELLTAWNHLQQVRTTGLYSNRALLTYAWAAIRLQRYGDAVPALQLQEQRAIAIPETQEAKVLLAHVYETQGAHRSALRQYLVAENAFKEGLATLQDARRIIAAQEIPQEFVINLEAMLDESDWYGMQPSLDYNKLTPFLTELMASNHFYSVIKELRDLYGIRRNLEFWQMQTQQHALIIRLRREQSGMEQLMADVQRSEQQFRFYKTSLQELRLTTLTLPEWDQERFASLWKNTMRELDLVDDRVSQVAAIRAPYRLSQQLEQQSRQMTARVEQELAATNGLIRALENRMRAVIQAELDRHEERIRYYWAQARLGKARLYDKALINLEESGTGATP